MKHYDGWMKKGIIILNTNSGTDYVFPHECCVMINVIIDCKAQVILSITLFLVYLVISSMLIFKRLLNCAVWRVEI